MLPRTTLDIVAPPALWRRNISILIKFSPNCSPTFRSTMRKEKINRLNWGCGNTHPPRWINSDVKSGKGIQVVADIRQGLPIASDRFDYAVSVHALPELGYPHLVPALRELRRVIKPKGTLRLVLPDLLKTIEAFRAGDRNFFAVPDDDAKRLGAKLPLHL